VKRAVITFVIGFLFGCGDSIKEEPAAICGDGIPQNDEQCDDGNDVDSDSCSNTCKTPGCGDGILNFDEACDDGNTVDGDGCNSVCRIEGLQ
jgi:cysteine-rich repeat protein